VSLEGAPAYILVYGQAMRAGFLKVSAQRHWIVKKELSQTERMSAALGILVVVNFDVIAWFTHNAKLRLIANCRLRDHSRITHYPFTQSLQKLPLPVF